MTSDTTIGSHRAKTRLNLKEQLTVAYAVIFLMCVLFLSQNLDTTHDKTFDDDTMVEDSQKYGCNGPESVLHLSNVDTL